MASELFLENVADFPDYSGLQLTCYTLFDLLLMLVLRPLIIMFSNQECQAGLG